MISLRCAFNEEDTYEQVDDYRITVKWKKWDTHKYIWWYIYKHIWILYSYIYNYMHNGNFVSERKDNKNMYDTYVWAKRNREEISQKLMHLVACDRRGNGGRAETFLRTTLYSCDFWAIFMFHIFKTINKKFLKTLKCNINRNKWMHLYINW